MNSRTAAFLSLATVLLFPSVPAQAAIPLAERNALIALYDTTNGPGWGNSTNWKGAPGTECTWSRITCDAAQTTVLEVDMAYNSLSGPIPPELSALTNLQFLSFKSNAMTGTLPSSLGQLTNLKYFACDAGDGTGQVTGPIPASFANLTKLETLDLVGERLDGSVPGFLVTFPNLKNLLIAGNRFTGTLPAGLFTKTSLVKLDLRYTSFSGTLPSSVDLPNLEELTLGNGKFTGPIPSGLGKSTRLRVLDMIQNMFTGPIPKELGSLPVLENLSLGDNLLDGPFPSELGNDVALKGLILGRNNLTGPMPSTIGQLKNLELLYLDGTGMDGPLPAEFFTLPKIKNVTLYSNQYSSVHSTFSGNLADFGRLQTLESLYIGGNKFTGPIPVALTQLPNLRELGLDRLALGGTIPPEIRNLKKLETLEIYSSGLTGAIPDEISELTNLNRFILNDNAINRIPASLYGMTQLKTFIAQQNRFSGPISPEFGRLVNLEYLRLDSNQFTGTVPPELFRLPLVQYLFISDNQLEGQLPPFAGIPKIYELGIDRNRFVGPIPSDIGTLKDLQYFAASENLLSGQIPPEVASATALREVYLADNELTGDLPDLSNLKSLRNLVVYGNRLTGPVPSWLGNVTTMNYLLLDGNRFTGNLPTSLLNLTNLPDGYLGLGYNALFTTDPTLRDFLSKKAGSWENTQTIAPSDVKVVAKSNSAVVSWTPILYTGDSGGYTIFVATNSGGPFTPIVTTPDKVTNIFTLDGLTPSTDFFVKVGTITFPHGNNKNVVTSDPSLPVALRTTNGTPAPATVVVLSYPYGMSEAANTATGTDRYVLVNIGELPATLTVSQEGDFFTQSPTSFTIAGGAIQEVSITAVARPEGTYPGFSIVSGSGVSTPIRIPIRLFTFVVPTGTVNATASQNRVDISATVDQQGLSGTVSFTNSGTATLRGVVIADVPWIIPPTDIIVIPPGQTVAVTFTIDRTKRPDAAALAGTAVGTFSLLYPTGTVAGAARQPFDTPPSSATSLVTVVDTVKPPVANVNFPPLRAGEVPLFLPGVGHVVGSVGTFLSDLSLINQFGVSTLDELKIFYTPASGLTQSIGATSVNGLQPGQALALADVVKSVYNKDAEQGTLQIRSLDWAKLALNASIFNISNAAGTYGTSIPAFRGDRALNAGQSLFLSGLRGSGKAHTNILIQETSGAAASFDVDFLAEDGTVVPSTSIRDTVPGFLLFRLISRVPATAVAARITNRSDSAGKLVAYATPVDEESGDFWSILDWNLQSGVDGSQPQVIPVAGTAKGANNNFFRTDLAISNRGTGEGSGTLRYYYDGDSGVAEQRVTLQKDQSRIYNDVIGTLFPALTNKVGFFIFTPDKSNFLVTSRTFATQEGIKGTFGTGVPTIPLSSSLYVGQSRLIAGLEVASLKTISAHTPATFRTNVGLLETTGKSVSVRVTVTYADLKSQSLAAGTRLISKTFDLKPHQFLQRNVSTQIIADANPSVGDLRNVQIEMRVVGGEGAVMVFTSSVDNGTADQILRTE